MTTYTCPNGHKNTQALVCGGDGPYYNHGAEEDGEATLDNIYFLMEIPSGELTEELYSDVPFELTEKDWAEMHEHADGGCSSEPQCLTCLEYLNVEEGPPTK